MDFGYTFACRPSQIRVMMSAPQTTLLKRYEGHSELFRRQHAATHFPTIRDADMEQAEWADRASVQIS